MGRLAWPKRLLIKHPHSIGIHHRRNPATLFSRIRSTLQQNKQPGRGWHGRRCRQCILRVRWRWRWRWRCRKDTSLQPGETRELLSAWRPRLKETTGHLLLQTVVLHPAPKAAHEPRKVPLCMRTESFRWNAVGRYGPPSTCINALGSRLLHAHMYLLIDPIVLLPLDGDQTGSRSFSPRK